MTANEPPHDASAPPNTVRTETGPSEPARIWPLALPSALIGLLASLAARFILGIPTPAETFGDQLTILIPLPLFSRLLDTFGHDAKHWFYGFLLVAQLVGATLIFAGYLAARRRFTARSLLTPADVAILALLPWLLLAGLVAPSIGGGFFGSALTGGVTGTFVSILVPALAGALTLYVLSRRPVPIARRGAPAANEGMSRRRLLRDVGFAAVVVAGGAVAWDFISGGVGRLLGISGPNQPNVNLGDVPAHVPPPTPAYASWDPLPGQTAEVTATSDFYYVSKNLASDPDVDTATWRLSIDGLVQAPYSLSYDDLRALPTVERFHTLECISNDVGGNLMSNARFTGVSLADLLERAGVKDGAGEVTFRAADGYSDALHLAQALDPRSLVVYLINGSPLPKSHGYPARLLIPGLYGMKNGKWLTSLSVGQGGYTGYWEQRGWTREALVKPTARIDVPGDGDFLTARPLTIAGVAYSGERGIGEVDVSTDGGQTFHPATFRPASLRRPLGPLTWVLWQFPWTPPAPGRYVLVARGVDLQGNVQTPAEAPPLPDGSSGYHRIAVTVR